MTDIKFCGMTRREDAQHAAALGARYVGVILTESPRRLDADAARNMFSGLAPAVQRVAVFGHETPEQIAALADRAAVDVIQLHGDQGTEAVRRVREQWRGRIWWVARVAGDTLPSSAHDAARDVDAIVLDARVDGALGGTGVTLRWEHLASPVDRLRGLPAQIVLAGGLTPENVRRAVEALRPDIVDVSSGVESAVGVKDHDRMRAFRDAVHNGRGQ